MKTFVVAVIVALITCVSASAATPQPVQCFRAHNWIVKGTNRHGTAWPRPKVKHTSALGSYYPNQQWQFTRDGYPIMTSNIGLTRKQRRIAHLCLRA